MNSLTKYKLIDLTIFALIMCLLEGLISFGRGMFPGEAYTLSIIFPVSLIVIMRWGWLGLIHAALGGAVYAALYGGEIRHLLIYFLGNLGIAVSVIYLLKSGKEHVRKSAAFTVLYILIGWCGLVTGRTGAALAFGAGTFGELVRSFYGAEVLNLIATIFILLIARKQNGVFEDQRHYLLRLNEEENRKK